MSTTAGTRPDAFFGTVSVPASVCPAGVGMVTSTAVYGASAGAEESGRSACRGAMLYAPAHHRLPSCIATTVSVAAAPPANAVANFRRRYSPDGAPGGGDIRADSATVRTVTAPPNDARACRTPASHA